MRVLILSQYYSPEPIAKPVELAAELSRRGHGVSVLTGLPNYPTGTLYPGYRFALVSNERVEGIPVTRTFEFPYHGKRAIGRLANYFSFMVSAPLGSRRVPDCDVIYVWHPPLTVGVAAWVISAIRRVPFVYDVQDIWPESAVLSGILKEGWLVRAISRLERFVYRRAHHVLVVTDGARDNLLAKGVDATKISVMPHWIDEQLFTDPGPRVQRAVRDEYGWGDRFVVLFAGNLGLVQGLDTVLAAAEQLQEDRRLLVVLMGDGSDRDRIRGAARGLEQIVQFIDRQAVERVPAFLAAADVLLVHLKKSALSRFVIPTKTIAYLAAGRPILMAMEGAAADLVRQASAGMVVPPECPSEMSAAIRRLADLDGLERAAMGKRGRAYLVEHFSKTKVINRYESVLEQVVRSRERH